MPVPAGAGRAPFSATDAMIYGWNAFKNNIGPLIIIGLVIVGVQIVVNFLSQSFNSFILQMVLNIAGLLLSLLLSLGLIRAALIICNGRAPKVEDVLSTKNLGPYVVASLLVWLIVTAGLILCIIPGLIAAFLFQFYGYAILDEKADDVGGVPSSDPVGSLRTSFAITSKHVGELILLALLIIVANMVGALLCGIGLIVSMPVSAIAIAFAWRYFSNGPIAAQA